MQYVAFSEQMPPVGLERLIKSLENAQSLLEGGAKGGAILKSAENAAKMMITPTNLFSLLPANYQQLVQGLILNWLKQSLSVT